MTKLIIPALLAAAALPAHAGLLDSFSAKKQEPAKTEAAPAQPGIADEAKKMAGDLAAEIAASSKKALEDTKKLLDDPATAGPVKEQLGKLAESLAGAKDGAAAEALAKLAALKPSEGQTALLKDLQANVGALVLGRNFDQKDPANGDVVKAAMDAIKAKDTAGAVANLQKLAGGAKLTDAQKQMAGNLLTSWNPKVAAAVDKAKKGAEMLKGFGL